MTDIATHANKDVMCLTAVPDMLAWRDPSGWSSVYDDYLRFARGAVASVVERVSLDADACAVRAAIEAEPNAIIARVLASPELTARLVWIEASDVETIGFFARALEREYARAYPEKASGVAPGWGALGDFAVTAEGRVHVPFAIDGMMPIDVESPYLANGFQGFTDGPIEPAKNREIVASRLVEVRDLLLASSPTAASFVTRFTQVLAVYHHPTEGRFTHGSVTEYTGRASIGNVDYPNVTASNIADALVHEAIHSLLLMHECSRTLWVSPDSFKEPRRPVISPWSGRTLPLRAFLHACFVWYGLAQFWREAVLRGAVSDAAQWMHTATKGFLGPSLLDAIADRRRFLLPELVDAIADMQRRVQAFGAP